jgi:GntR family transcriptional regulator, transcriptional repressor for pyruvate dehydrogenase complex
MEPPLRALGRDERRRARLPRMAEVVADSLRTQILEGDLTVVPQLDVLIRHYDVGPPAAREALRILETEGLITVRRGKVGGADVHMPTNERVAYTLSLVLQATGTSLSDVGAALRKLTPVCAAMCAERQDRAESLVPRLQKLNEEQAAAMGDRLGTMRITDEFHSLLIEECGNETLVQVVGALEHVWASLALEVLDTDEVELAPAKLWKAALREHEKIVDAIEEGDAERVADLARRHLTGTHAYMSTVDDQRKVSASVVHRRL